MTWRDTLNEARYSTYVEINGPYEPTPAQAGPNVVERVFDEGHELALVTFFLAQEAIWRIQGWIGEKICFWMGQHRWEDVGSYAGPESAAEHFVCTRCGASHHHIYY